MNTDYHATAAGDRSRELQWCSQTVHVQDHRCGLRFGFHVAQCEKGEPVTCSTEWFAYVAFTNRDYCSADTDTRAGADGIGRLLLPKGLDSADLGDVPLGPTATTRARYC